jgi:uncharacterized protein (TIGR02646 family)
LIQLVRPAEPELLVQHRVRWTARWTDSLREGRKIGWATQSAVQALRDPLLAFSRGKCAFCEGLLRLTSYDEIEHYHAKTVQPDLAFDWQNLFPACSLCNRSKGDLDHQGRLLKPDSENTELLLWLHPDSGELQPHPTLNAAQAQRVLETIDAYNLQRGVLCTERIDMMNFVKRWLIRAAGEVNASAECQAEWNYMIRPSTPWKFVIRHVLSQSGQEQLAEIDRQTFLAGT